MKLKISLAFIALYLLSLVLTAPASLLIRFVPKNSGVEIGEVSGTVWQGKLSQLDYRNQFQLQRLTWDFDWLALFTLNLKADIKFNNGRRELVGNGSVVYGLDGPALTNVNAQMQATEIMPYLQLPVPVTPSGNFELVIEHFTQGSPYCDELDGYLVWHDGNVETPMGNIDFATPNVDLSCDEGNLAASLKQQSDDLIANANILLTKGGRYQLEGDIMGGEQLDPNILQALSWLGPKQKSGETLLNLKGRL